MTNPVIGVATLIGAAILWPKAIKVIRDELKRKRPTAQPSQQTKDSK